MARIFVSHTDQDRALAHMVAEKLQAQSHTVFLDFSPRHGVSGGLEWEKAILGAIRQSDAVVLCCTPAVLSSQWCFAEVLIARYEGKKIFPLLLNGSSDNVWDFLSATVQYIDFTEDPDRGYERLADALRASGYGSGHEFLLSEGVAQLDRPPYAGLRPLQSEDQSLFFARQEEVEQLVGLLQPRPGGVRRRFLTVIGASGSGKSSLVRAGLVPRLLAGAVPGSKEWLYVSLTPGADPYRNLAEGLRRAVPLLGTVRRIEDSLRDGVEGIDYTVADALTLRDEESHLLLFIDQLEELVTRPRDQGDATAFVEALLHAANDGSPDRGPITVISTARADFYSSLLELPNVGSALLANPYPLSSLPLHRLREVIEGPARIAGIRFEEGLVDQILDDAAGADVLPLLSFVLRAMYDAMPPASRMFAHRSYQAVGTLQGAIGLQAEQAYADLSTEVGTALISDILQHLVVVTGDGKAVRRRARRSDLSDSGRSAIDKFVEARLLVASEEGGVATIEVAHEAIFRHWERLASSIARDTAAIQYVRQVLQQAFVDWQRLGIFPGSEQRRLINTVRDTLTLDSDQLDLVIRSSLRANDDVDYWLERFFTEHPTPMRILEIMLTAADPVSRHHLLDYIERSVGFRPELRSLLPSLTSSKYPALVRHALRLTSSQAENKPSATSPLAEMPFVTIPAGACIVGPADSGVLVEVPQFEISRFLITNLEFRAFVDQSGAQMPTHWTENGFPGKADHPVVYVSFEDACAYCRWLSEETGRIYRLPSEIEWEKAAGWDSGQRRKRLYPWGDDFDTGRCNVWESQMGGTTPIGQYSPHGGDSAYGISDMAGNVWEWTTTIGRVPSGDPYPYPSATQDNRDDLAVWAPRVQKGGTFLARREYAVTCSRLINLPELALQDFGFRVVRTG